MQAEEGTSSASTGRRSQRLRVEADIEERTFGALRFGRCVELIGNPALASLEDVQS